MQKKVALLVAFFTACLIAQWMLLQSRNDDRRAAEQSHYRIQIAQLQAAQVRTARAFAPAPIDTGCAEAQKKFDMARERGDRLRAYNNVLLIERSLLRGENRDLTEQIEKYKALTKVEIKAGKAAQEKHDALKALYQQKRQEYDKLNDAYFQQYIHSRNGSTSGR